MVDDFGEGEVEAVGRAGSGLHRGAEAGGRGLRAIHGDDEDGAAAGVVDGIGKAVFEQDAVLHADGGEFAGADSEEGVAGRRVGVVEDAEGGAVALGFEEAHVGRVKELFPTLGADDVAEEGAVVAFLEAVAAGFLFVGPADGEIFEGAQGVVDDGAVADGGTDHLVAAASERRDQLVEGLEVHDGA